MMMEQDQKQLLLIPKANYGLQSFRQKMMKMIRELGRWLCMI